MTRDEAIELRLKNIGARTRAILPDDALREITAAEIDFYIASGMLKLDEPKSAHQRMVDACRALDISGRVIDVFATALENGGLMVVEK
jgi:hypothetical protein